MYKKSSRDDSALVSPRASVFFQLHTRYVHTTIRIEKRRACKTYRSVHCYILWDQTSRELESAVPRISVSFFRQKIDRMVAVLHGKYAWHNLKANVQGEGLPSPGPISMLLRNPTPLFILIGGIVNAQVYEFTRVTSFLNNRSIPIWEHARLYSDRVTTCIRSLRER